MQQVSSWLHPISRRLQPQLHQLTSLHPISFHARLSQPLNLLETWVLSNVYAFSTRTEQTKTDWLRSQKSKRFHVKMQQECFFLTSSFRWRQSWILYRFLLRPFSGFCFDAADRGDFLMPSSFAGRSDSFLRDGNQIARWNTNRDKHEWFITSSVN